MARRPSGVARALISFRVDQAFKDRLTYLAFHEHRSGVRPSEVNLSDFARGLLEEYVHLRESEIDGGAVRLREDYLQARTEETRRQLDSLLREAEEPAGTSGAGSGRRIAEGN